MATVRIYKVAELLGTTSQEVTALLKRDHGIEVKSASSTIEEVVGRQFVERLAKQRNITLPTGDIFAETPAAEGRQEARASEKGSRAAEACCTGAAAAASGEDGEAPRHDGPCASRRGAADRSRAAAAGAGTRSGTRSRCARRGGAAATAGTS